MMCESFELGELKEDSTAYVSAWVKRHIWDLPVEVPYVPRRRRLGICHLCSRYPVVYSYTVLYIIARFVGNVFRNFDPDWSFIPELLTAAFIFRGRIRKLVKFMKLVYLDKRDRVRSWAIFRHPLYVLAAVLLFCVPAALARDHHRPLCPRTPARRLCPRARSRVDHAGLRLRGHAGRSRRAAFPDEQPQPSLGAGQERRRLRHGRNARDLRARCATPITAPPRKSANASPNKAAPRMPRLRLSMSPARFRASSLTPRVHDLLGSHVAEGTELAEVADLANDASPYVYVRV